MARTSLVGCWLDLLVCRHDAGDAATNGSVVARLRDARFRSSAILGRR
jgi:hypothetical protein